MSRDLPVRGSRGVNKCDSVERLYAILIRLMGAARIRVRVVGPLIDSLPACTPR
jgi:hypothetical protein